ncbi:MAG: hypothetical protein JXR96_12435 [Deltaproteobacteria bacterium]|nr:hypothetical protein [Deltaproteobacteria bacterium]
MRLSIPFLAGLVLICLSSPSNAGQRAPSAKKLGRDVGAHWKEHWPEQELAHVGRKGEACERAEIELPIKGKPRKVETCLVRADIFVARGYRYFIYRDTHVHYWRGRIVSLQLGELEKAWKAGGVPAPTAEQALELLRPLAGERVRLEVLEIGKPRSYKELMRVSLLVDLARASLDGGEPPHEKVLVTLESDGGDWKPAAGLLF